MSKASHLRAVPDEFQFEAEEPRLRGATEQQATAHKAWVNNKDLPEDFYLASDPHSQDKKGHGEATYIKVPPEAKGQVARLVEDPNTPYRSSGDVYRHALMHLFRDIENHNLTGDSYTDQVKRILTKARAETRRIEILTDENMVQASGLAIEAAMRTRNTKALAKAVEEARQTVAAAESDVSSLERLIDGAVRELER